MSDTLRVFAEFVVDLGGFVGFCMICVGLFTIRRNAQNQSQYPLGNALATVGAGVALMSMEFIYASLYITVFDTRAGLSPISPLAPSPDVLNAQPSNTGFTAGVARYIPAATSGMVATSIWALGLLAYFRGLYELRHAGVERPGVDYKVSSAFAHIAGGFCLINIDTVGCGLTDLFGMGLVCAQGGP